MAAAKDRIGFMDLRKEKFKPTAIKESTWRRLNLARRLIPFYEGERYRIIERALEFYYRYTRVVSNGKERSLLELINEKELSDEIKNKD